MTRDGSVRGLKVYPSGAAPWGGDFHAVFNARLVWGSAIEYAGVLDGTSGWTLHSLESKGSFKVEPYTVLAGAQLPEGIVSVFRVKETEYHGTIVTTTGSED